MNLALKSDKEILSEEKIIPMFEVFPENERQGY